ncbi:MAG: sigma-70 family RNA polymerase sigma factor [Myxococcales bacterium]|nr:sigma-70 family RNA polymerase sigma factor [Myxococcales bacterium]
MVSPTLLARLATVGPVDAGRVSAFLSARGVADDGDHVEDLAMACEALARAKWALASFEHRLVRACQHVDASLRDEVRSRLMERLLLGTSPHLATWAGRTSLGSWLTMVARREAAALRQRPVGEQLEDERWSSFVAGERGPESLVIGKEAGARLSKAIASALAKLTEQERELITEHLLEGVPVTTMAAQRRVPRSTLALRVTEAKQRLLEFAKSALVSGGIDVASLDSFIERARDNLDASTPFDVG